MEICRKLISYKQPDDGGRTVLQLDEASMAVWFMTDRILRIRVVFPEDDSEKRTVSSEKTGEETPSAKTAEMKTDASYILQTTAWKDRLDEMFEGDRTRICPQIPVITESETEVRLATKALTLAVQKNPLELALYDSGGNELYRSVSGNPFLRDNNRRIQHFSRMEEDDCFYGFGEKGGRLNKNKEFIRERATDSWGYDPEKCESVFNLGREKSNYWPRYTYWQADGGEIDLFLLTGPKISTILDDYTMLTGRPALLPKRALGYQGSSMYYSELEKDSDKALIEFIDNIREKGFPIDGFHLSSGYTAQGGLRCVFTWNHERFPDPEGFFAAMNERGAQNVPNVKPGVLTAHPMFQEFCDKGVFVRDSKDPEQPAVGAWWGGPGAFWDFTSQEARKAWKEYLTKTVIAVGTDSIWDDNCEYDSLLDKEARCCYDGEGGIIGGLKPIMCTIMSRLACEAVREYDGARPYVVCRSGSAGIQKYAQNWIGDNYTSWQTLRHNLPTILGESLSGQPNTGADIGGFAGPAPEEELFVRWVQHGIFQPRFSIHSSSSDNTVTEPWMYHGSTGRIRDAILLRYRMLPHLYSLERQAHLTGAPIMRALVYEFQDDPAVYEIDDMFLLGRDLLVANVLEKGVSERKVYLPKGTVWYALEENFARYEGGQMITVPVTIDSIPRFVREGAILPMAGNQLYSMEKDKVTDLQLLMVPSAEAGKASEYVVYDDDGRTNAFEDGVFRSTKIRMTGGEIVQVDFSGEGSYEDTIETVKITMVRKEKSPFWVSLDGEKLPHFLDRVKFEKADTGWYYSGTNRAVEIRYPNPKKDAQLLVSFEEFDLLGM